MFPKGTVARPLLVVQTMICRSIDLIAVSFDVGAHTEPTLQIDVSHSDVVRDKL